jgi:hypothetical protein
MPEEANTGGYEDGACIILDDDLRDTDWSYH